MTFFSYLCPITLQKRREWNFLISRLIALNIPYKWGFPFKLLIEYKGVTVVIHMLQQAEEFGIRLEIEGGLVEVLNEHTEVLSNRGEIAIHTVGIENKQ